MSAPVPRVSVGLPVYNGETLIRSAVDSLLAQTYRDFELIISDNASTDGTEAICRRYVESDPRVRYERSPRNRGLAWNYNRVFELARGEYFKWAAHDDVCEPTFVERCVELLERIPEAVVAYPQTVLIDEHGRRIQDYASRLNLTDSRPNRRFFNLVCNLGLSNPIFGVMRAAVLRRTPRMRSYVASDVALLAELALLGEFRQVPERLFLRRDHPQKSDRANPTLEGVANLYDPTNRGKIHLLNWRLFREHLASIWRVPIGPVEKSRCAVHMLRWGRWHWRELRDELRGGARQLLHRSRTTDERSGG